MNVIVTGKDGQLGRSLLKYAPQGVRVHAFGRAELDITDKNAVIKTINKIGPGLIINAAAYTAVDKAETEKAQAFAVNEMGVANMADGASMIGARLIHISTDFVFDGKSGKPYRPEDTPNPLNVYGKSKLAGERAARRRLQDHCLIIRTSWVYSNHGANFVKTMLRVMEERDALSVVSDQTGTPSFACNLAKAIWRLRDREVSGIVHHGDAGVASWYDFAVAIKEEAVLLNLLKGDTKITPIRTESFPTAARRPAYSVLDKHRGWDVSNTTPQHWREALRIMLKAFKE